MDRAPQPSRRLPPPGAQPRTSAMVAAGLLRSACRLGLRASPRPAAWRPAAAARAFGSHGDPRAHLNPDGTRPEPEDAEDYHDTSPVDHRPRARGGGDEKWATMEIFSRSGAWETNCVAQCLITYLLHEGRMPENMPQRDRSPSAWVVDDGVLRRQHDERIAPGSNRRNRSWSRLGDGPDPLCAAPSASGLGRWTHGDGRAQLNSPRPHAKPQRQQARPTAPP